MKLPGVTLVEDGLAALQSLISNETPYELQLGVRKSGEQFQSI